jgi:hypothetical protein
MQRPRTCLKCIEQDPSEFTVKLCLIRHEVKIIRGAASSAEVPLPRDLRYEVGLRRILVVRAAGMLRVGGVQRVQAQAEWLGIVNASIASLAAV